MDHLPAGKRPVTGSKLTTQPGTTCSLATPLGDEFQKSLSAPKFLPRNFVAFVTFDTVHKNRESLVWAVLEPYTRVVKEDNNV